MEENIHVGINGNDLADSARTHTDTHTHAETHMWIHTDMPVLKPTRNMSKYIQPPTDKHTRAKTPTLQLYTHTRKCRGAYVHTDTHTHTTSHTLTLSLPLSHTHTHSQTDIECQKDLDD